MKRTRLAALVLSAAALTACGSGTVTPVPTATSAVPAPEVPRVHADDDAVRVDVLPPVVGPVADAGAVVPADTAAGSVDHGARVVQGTPAAVTVTRQPRPVRTPPVVVTAPATAGTPATHAEPAPAGGVSAPVIDRSTRPTHDPIVPAAPGSAGESVPGVESVVIAPAPVIDRGTRDVADPPVVVGDTAPAADVVAADEGRTLLEKER